MNKPSWKDAPPNAQWLAQDLNGSWHWFSQKPHIDHRDTYTWAGEGHVWADQPNPDWKSTLEARPCVRNVLIEYVDRINLNQSGNTRSVGGIILDLKAILEDYPT